MKITARWIYEQSCLLIFETPDDDDDLKTAFPAFLNQVLADALDYENMFRRAEGTELLSADDLKMYVSADDTTTIPFHAEVLRKAAPLGVKAYMLEDDSTKKSEAVLYYNKFVEALNSCAPAVYSDYEGAEE